MAHLSYQQQTTFSAFRLRTKRQRRRATIEDRDKRLLAFDRKHTALWKQRRNLPLIPLEPPVVRGWKRSFVLRDDVARSKDAALYERVLKHINNTQYSHRRDFKKKKRSKGRKIHVLREQHLTKLDAWDWNKLPPEEAALFGRVEKPSFHRHERPTYRYVFREPWRYVLRVELNTITQTRQHDETLEAEYKMLNTYLDCPNRRGRLEKLLYGRSYRRWRGTKPKDLHYTSRRPFRNLPLHALLTEEQNREPQ